jgi:hypothetical protein
LKRTLRYHAGIFNKFDVINLQLNIWQLNWQNEANPNDKEMLINGNNVIRINKLEEGVGGEKTDRQSSLAIYITQQTQSKKGEGAEIGRVFSNDVILVYTCVNLKTNKLGALIIRFL